MRSRSLFHARRRFALAPLLAFGAAACGVASADSGVSDPAAQSVAAASAELRVENAGLDDVMLTHAISQVMFRCYGVGADLVGEGDVDGAKQTLRGCFAPDMSFEVVMPPAYEALAFTTTGGADGFVDFSNGFYRSLHLVRTQHLFGQVVVDRLAPGHAHARTAATAVHVFPDEHALNATVVFDDDLELVDGAWKFVRRTMTVTSLTTVAAASL